MRRTSTFTATQAATSDAVSAAAGGRDEAASRAAIRFKVTSASKPTTAWRPRRLTNCSAPRTIRSCRRVSDAEADDAWPSRRVDA